MASPVVTRYCADHKNKYNVKYGCSYCIAQGKVFVSEDTHYNGPEYSSSFDDSRLQGQMKRVYNLMIDRKWRTLQEIADITKDPPSSVSAQLRHLRKDRFGNHTIDRQARGDRKNGLFEYRLTK